MSKIFVPKLCDNISCQATRAERDAFKAALEKRETKYEGYLQKLRDDWKADIEEKEADRDRWREMAEKIAGALRDIESFDTTRFFEGSSTHINPRLIIIEGECAKIAKQALKEFDEAMKK